MDFQDKLKELRKNRGLTQEELAQALFVSRTAISKWESGKGYPNIDSLKAISKYFCVSLDDLLSTDEIITIAEEDGKQKERHLRNLVFGLLDCSIAMFLFLPFFGQRVDGVIQEVSVLMLTEEEIYIKIPYLIIVFSMTVWGILMLALQDCQVSFWLQKKDKISLGLGAVGALLFMISRQPYASAYLFLILVIQALMLIKWA
ncbi:MAG: helix-turn-helix domain-containing protein [Clostridiales bacterium]|nr:helix-turn-helix domain-containing protein [Clostridiales bacterium]